MSLKKKKLLGVVDFIHPDDGAINTDLDESTGKPFSDLAKYRETWDFEKYCVLREDVKPTIFKLNFAVSYRKAQAIKNATLGGDGKKEEFGFKLGNHQYQVVRSVLIDIVNPEGTAPEDCFKFKRTGDNLVAEETMEELESVGVIEDIYSFYLTTKEDPELVKKK